MEKLPFESAERFALRALLEAMETPRTQKASAAWDAAHKVIEATRLAAHGYRVQPTPLDPLPWHSSRRTGPNGFVAIGDHWTQENAIAACERDYRARFCT